MDGYAALILAAGKGTRMHAEKPKVLQTLLGTPMLEYVVASLRPLFGTSIWAVVGYKSDLIRTRYPDLKTILQEEQLGTGHAVRLAFDALDVTPFETLLVINGDAPLITTPLVQDFLTKAKGFDVAFATALVDDPGAYGRVVRHGDAVVGIVEAKNYSIERYGAPSGEINIGLYAFSKRALQTLLPRLTKDSVSGEIYVTDMVGLAKEASLAVGGIVLGRDTALLGVNSPKELIAMEEELRQRIVEEALSNGVLIHAPHMVRIGPFVQLMPGAELVGPLEIYGKSVIKSGAFVGSHCVLHNAVLEENARVNSFCHLEDVTVCEGALLGPFARLRPGTLIDRNAHVGNFVELKKTHLGEGAKANHLSYLGDAEIGPKTNIGAGTITCNYDGVHKHPTVIGDNAFIGSNTALVAPVSVGAGAFIGAGSTITHDVPPGNLAVARGKQKNYTERMRKIVASDTKAREKNPS
ncbi:MAG: bifunctional UDP-N-acetylglucosamine diphosphorylase/glucosamine-1-phosphate N-acetyltransferase GlmU [Desulfovibrio sp.]|nr:bifunctional UDP-N-acetylglucosamine diphosphorylase/glucosamine-1-phosphate N-acetyltransferase GlmU [Desulfovibrio sp.]